MRTTIIKCYVIILLINILVLTSCKKDWFDRKSDMEITVPSGLKDFEMLLDNMAQISLGSPGLGEVASDGHYTTDNIWATMNDIPVYIVQKNAYIWTKNNPNTEVKDWNYPYSVIFICNLVLEGLAKIDRTEGNKFQYDQIRGNALFHRARAYYELTQIFTPPYNILKDSQYGLPFKNSTDVAEKITRKSVHETFSIIESDLALAASLLSNKQLPVTRGSKSACWGFLARISLIKGKYSDALEFANRVLEIDNELIDFNEISPLASNLGLFNKEVIFHSAMNALHLTYFPRFCLIDPSFVELYEDNDLRKSIFFRVNATGITFKGMYNNRTVQFAGLATDEILLIKAESLVRTGKLIEGMNVLNSLLRFRYRKNEDGTSTLHNRTAASEEEGLKVILAERRKELLMRGIRWSDLRRLNFDPRFAVTLSRSINGQTFTLRPNSDKYALPIPDDEISYSGISQNPGWE